MGAAVSCVVCRISGRVRLASWLARSAAAARTFSSPVRAAREAKVKLKKIKSIKINKRKVITDSEEKN